ncbi:restriction endonuclease subunit S [Lactococcus lactis]|uniref:restriction endonuclease subunit S n=1 Tax=Lactococcus lactis TaxID=1358 RepID=UPI00345C6B47
MKMKDSGVEWIGEIPEDWDIGKVNRALKYVKEVAGDKHGLYPRLSLAKSGVIERPKYDGNGQAPADYNTYQIVPKQQFVFNLMGLEQDSDYRRVGVPEKSGLLSSGYVRMDNNSDVLNVKYGYYYFLTLESYRIFNAYGTGIRSTLNGKQLEKLPLILPAIDEQQKIADFLDSKIALIDQIIADTKRSIEELKSYKQSLITETVTKGLDPNVPMKDSGVEWIREIPEGWKLPSLGQLSIKIGSGKTPLGGANVYQESGVLFIRSQNVYDTGLLLGDKATYISQEVNDQMKNTEVQKQDILLNITGGSIGRSVKYNLNTPANVNQHVCIIRSINNIIDPDFLTYFLNSSSGQTNVNYFQTGGNREGLNFEQIKKFKIPLPVMKKQKNIIIFLDEKTKKIDALIKDKNLVISENESYKKSLIYEYVTGKKQVN